MVELWARYLLGNRKWSRWESNPRPLDAMSRASVRRPATAPEKFRNIRPPGPLLSVALGAGSVGVHRQNTDSRPPYEPPRSNRGLAIDFATGHGAAMRQRMLQLKAEPGRDCAWAGENLLTSTAEIAKKPGGKRIGWTTRINGR